MGWLGRGRCRAAPGLGPSRTPRPAFRLWAPVLLAFLIQVPGSLFAWQGSWSRASGEHGLELRPAWPATVEVPANR